ncbi:MAG: guanine deaminase [Nitrospirae bacterium]|nr:guanine deaminase [Nitrospirota bacterium]
MSEIHRAAVLHATGIDSIAYYGDGALVVDPDGKIESLGPWHGRSSGGRIHDHRPALLLPGFVDCHFHIPQIDVRGRYGFSLLEWLDRFIYPAERACADPETARDAARRAFQSLMAHGTTTVAAYTSCHVQAAHAAFEEAEAAGIRAVIGNPLMDRETPPDLRAGVDALAACEEIASRWEGKAGRLFYAFTPRFAVSCTPALLAASAEAARRTGCRIMTHLAENEEEVRRVRSLFGGDRSYAAVYDSFGLLGPGTIVAHAIHVTAEDSDLLARAGASVAHCPSSNFFLRSGRMDIGMLDNHGVIIGLGTDVGAGPSFSLWETMRDMLYTNEKTPARAFSTATRGGAGALGLWDRIGDFSAEKEADFCVYDVPPGLTAGSESRPDELIAALIFTEGGAKPREVWIGGRRIL